MDIILCHADSARSDQDPVYNMAEGHNDIVLRLEKHTQEAPPISDVLYASQKAFQLLEPWLAAR